MKGETSVVKTVMKLMKDDELENIKLQFMIEGKIYDIDQVDVHFSGDHVKMVFMSEG